MRITIRIRASIRTQHIHLAPRAAIQINNRVPLARSIATFIDQEGEEARQLVLGQGLSIFRHHGLSVESIVGIIPRQGLSKRPAIINIDEGVRPAEGFHRGARGSREGGEDFWKGGRFEGVEVAGDAPAGEGEGAVVVGVDAEGDVVVDGGFV
jgi:hypothetical protein